MTDGYLISEVLCVCVCGGGCVCVCVRVYKKKLDLADALGELRRYTYALLLCRGSGLQV